MARLGAMGAVAAVLIGFFIFITTRLSAPMMIPLYSDLTMEDSTAITRELDADNVPYELKGDGSTILVPGDMVLKLRMQLAGDGLPTGGSVGYEVFDKSNTLGATSFVQNINHLRALEGELARTIRTIDRIAFARVHLVIPERQLFQRDKSETTASIVLKVRGSLEASQVRAIQHLVASAVDGLKPERVSIVDESGDLLASGAGGGDSLLAGSLAERTVAYETRLQRDIGAIVSSVVGSGRARIQVAADFDYNRITRTADSFDPETQVVRSAQRRIEESASTSARGGAVSVGNALPDAGPGSGGGASGGDTNNNTEETINYEISRTTTTEVLEPGRLKRISVAVLVDGTYSKNDAGELQYQARPQEELDRINALVRSAVGFDKARGDAVEIVNLRFAEAPRIDEVATVESGGFLGLEKADYFYIAQLAVTILLGLAVLFFGVRPLVRRVLKPDETAAAGAPVAYAAPAAGAVARPAAAPPTITRESASETAIQIEQAMQTGALHADTIKRVGSLVEENPADAVAIVRSWLADAA